MTTAPMCCTVFWESLKGQGLLTRYPDFTTHDVGLAVPVLSSCLLLAFMPIFFLAFSRSRKDDHIRTGAALQALLTVIVPTCSLWPSRYTELASVPRSCISIPLELIIKDTIEGVVEFRNPINDLAHLIGSGVTAEGRTICISIEWKWWINSFGWWMGSKFKSDYPSWDLPGYPPSSPPLALFLSSFALTPATSLPLLCLDYLPSSFIPSLNAGCKVALEFTALSPSLRRLSTAQIISTIPFILSEGLPRRPRSLVSVLKQLRDSYGPNLVVDSFSNVSTDYEYALRRVYHSISGEQQTRGMWVKTLGIRAWRRDMFLVAFEAALVRRGWIERWAIQVTVK